MIHLDCLEKNAENNPYLLKTILLWKEKKDYYAAFTCENKEKYELLLLHVQMLLSSERAESAQLSFLLVETKRENTLLVKGNIAKAVEFFIGEKILKGANQSLFNDLDEVEVQAFLQESVKVRPYVRQEIKKVMVDKDEKLDDPRKHCTLL